MDPLLEILRRCTDAGVEYVLIGGMAAVAHGSPMMTRDADVCAPLTHENVLKIIRALSDLTPRWRMRPDLPPISVDSPMLDGLKNLYLRTDIGAVDVLGELPGVGTFEQIVDRTVPMDVGGFVCRVLDLDTLIAAKTAAGRDKDVIGVRHLEAIKKLRRENPGMFPEGKP